MGWGASQNRMLEVNQLKLIRQGDEFCYDLSCQPGQVVALLGQSGCGKSTLLAMIAGFETASGTLLWQGHSILELPVAQRPVSSLFQQHNLFEHLTVKQNLALGINGRLKLNRYEQERLAKVAEQLAIAPWLTSYPGALSGGQIQRAALARALLRQRPILLLDEPFSALDPVLRADCLTLVRNLADEHQLAVLLVTHQFSDACAIADEVAFIEQGRVIQQCSPQVLQSNPVNAQVAQFLAITDKSIFPGEDCSRT